MDRRFSAALAVSMVIMVLYMMMLGRSRRPVQPPVPEPGATAPDASAGAGQTAGASQTGGGEAPADPTPDLPPPTDADRNDDILVETDLFEARLSNHGAVLRELYSRKYQRHVTHEGDAEAAGADPAGAPDEAEDNRLALLLDLDPEQATLLLRGGSERGFRIHERNWEWEVRPVDGGTDVVFQLQSEEGTWLEKVLSFRDGREDIGVLLRFRHGPESRGRPAFYLTSAGNLPDSSKVRFQKKPTGVVATDQDYDERTPERSGEQSKATSGQRVEYFGNVTNYFACVLRPDDEAARAITSVAYEPVVDHPGMAAEIERRFGGRTPSLAERAELEKDFRNNVCTVATLSLVAEPGTTQELRFFLFAGPKDPNLLADDAYQALRSLYREDYGTIRMFRWINPTLLWVLRLFQSLVGNWGVAIILLTVLVKALLFPMNRLQSRTMEQFQKKMAKLKPQLDELKKKYKNNMRKFHEEQQKLMREHQVRAPVLGCLVLFLQLPVFVGLFQILRTSFELRQQPFFLWVDDLSMPDALPLPFSLPLIGASLNVLPVLMIIAMVAHSKMMPKPADPQQAQMQKTMMFMPFVFGIFLYTYASGLSLYMLVNAILGILQARYLKVATAT